VIDFSRMTVMQDTFIAPDFRHLETDVLLRAPLRGRRGKGERAVYVYQLIEHQSEPDELAVYRALRYQMQVFDMQAQEWQREHGSSRGLAFDPVLPVVIYTGTRGWSGLTPMQELVRQSALFGEGTPSLKPVFFNLAATPAETLHQEAGLMGWVLHLMQQRGAGEGDFRGLMVEVVRQVEGLPEAQRGRWQELLWYLQAMVYHARRPDEHQPLVELIRETERSRARKKEVRQMAQSMAEFLMEQGKKEGKQEALLRQMRTKFRKLPARIEAQVRATKDDAQLDRWLDEVLTADELSEMSFAPSG
jgi:hypothetical protein